MPAEQALTEARRRSGPSYGPGGGGHLAFRARLEESAAFLAPLLLIGGLALSGGGFSLSSRHIAGLVVWLVIVGLLALGAAGRMLLAKPFYWASGLLLGLAIWSAISSLWSGSVELSVTEADRVLMYLGVFLAAFLLAQTTQRRQRFGEGIAIALAAVAILALSTRLLPHVFDLSFEASSGSRLKYPTGYWNADAILFSFTAALLPLDEPPFALRCLALDLGRRPAPALLALYFTHSRGGILTLLVAAGTLIVLSHDRLWYLATLLIAAILTMPAVLATHSYPELSNNYDFPPIVGQGLKVGGDPDRRDRRDAARLLGPAPGSSAAARRRSAAPWRSPATAACSAGSRSSPSSPLVIAGISLRRHRLAKVHQRRPRRPPTAGLARSLQPRPHPVLGSGARRLRRKADPRPRRRHLPVRLGPAAADRDDEHPGPLALPAGARRARDRRRRCSPWRWS